MTILKRQYRRASGRAVVGRPGGYRDGPGFRQSSTTRFVSPRTYPSRHPRATCELELWGACYNFLIQAEPDGDFFPLYCGHERPVDERRVM
jgi:hypothetical protein